MKKQAWFNLALLLLCLTSWTWAKEEPAWVRVGLAVRANDLQITLPESMTIYTENGGSSQLEAGVYRLSPTSDGIALGDYTLPGGQVRIVPANSQGVLGYQNRFYRGEFIVLKRSGCLTLVNRLLIEDYLRGVVPLESSPKWPIESLKAQAVAARTYTVSSLGGHHSQGFDLCTRVHCQVYGGASAEEKITDQAVAETRGEILVWEGKPIIAVYHASSGGFTENVENVWGWTSPYLRGVPDLDRRSPYAYWEKNWSWSEFSAHILETYPQLGYVRWIQPVSYGVSGRLSRVKVEGSEGSLTISGEKLRSILGLRSTLVELVLQNEKEEIRWAPGGVIPGFSQIDAGLKASIGWEPWPALLLGVEEPKNSFKPEKVVLKGSGWGHGVGMSQWGAKAMADQGQGYRDILAHYYKSARIVGSNRS